MWWEMIGLSGRQRIFDREISAIHEVTGLLWLKAKAAKKGIWPYAIPLLLEKFRRLYYFFCVG